MANDANIIKIKRSGTSGAPASLKLGELAYSYLTASGNPTSNGGDRLFIGANGSNVAGNANDVIVIGGKYFTDLLDHTRGELTASSALIVDANKKLDELLVDDLSLNGNTLSTTSGGLNVILSANGNGLVQINTSTNSFTLPATRTATTGYVLTANTDGTTSWSASASALSLSDGTNAKTVNLLEDNVVIQGKSGSKVSTAITRTGSAGAYTYTLDIDANLSDYVTATTLSGYNYIDLTDLSAGANDTASGSGSFSYDNLTGIFTYTPPDLSSYLTGITSSDVTTALGFTPYSDANPSGYISGITSGDVTTALGFTPYDDTNPNSYIALTNLSVGADGSATGSGSISYENTTGVFTYTPPDLSGYAESSDTIYIGTTAVTLNQASGTVSALTGIDSVSSSAGTGAVTLKANTGTGDKSFTFDGDGSFELPAGGLISEDTNTVIITPSGATSEQKIKIYPTAGLGEGDHIHLASGNLATTSIFLGSDSQYVRTRTNGGMEIGTGVTYPDSTPSTGYHWIFGTDGTTQFPNYTFPAAKSTTAGYVLTDVAGDGTLSWQAAAASFTVTGTTGSETLSLLTDTFSTVSADTNLSVAVTKTGTTVTSTITLAGSLTDVSIDGNAATVTNGVYTTDTATVTNTMLANSTIYIGTTQVTLGDTSGTTTSLAVDISGKATTAGNADTVTNGVYTTDTGTVTNTMLAGSIDNSKLSNSTISGVALGNSLYALSEGANIAAFSFDGSGTATVALTTSLTGLTEVNAGDLRLSGSTIDNNTSSTGNVVLVANDGTGDKTFTFGGDGTLNVAGKITGVATPTDANDAANKAYVDATRSGLDVKASVRATTTGNITLSNTQTIDGVALSVDDRVLVKNQSTASQNGIYVVASGAWTRADDADNSPAGEVTGGMFTFVEEGSDYADSGWVLSTNGTITLGTTDLTFVQFSGAGQIVAGSGLTKTGNTLDVNVANGIEIANDNVQLASSVAGNGLTYTNGVLDVVGTTDRISVTANAIDIATTYAGQTSITTLGTIGTGVWQGSLIGPTYGGTGVNNGSNTITIGGNVSTGGAVTFSGAYGFTGTLTAATNVTFPTTGTLVNKDETTLSSLSSIGTITTGVWNGTALTYAYGGTGQTSYAKGDLLYASGANTLSKLTAGTAGQMLQLQDGVPVWADLDGGTY